MDEPQEVLGKKRGYIDEMGGMQLSDTGFLENHPREQSLRKKVQRRSMLALYAQQGVLQVIGRKARRRPFGLKRMFRVETVEEEMEL